ncbi:MAG: hypothetical protein AAGI37_12560 [Planctomycetota bacterium]
MSVGQTSTLELDDPDIDCVLANFESVRDLDQAQVLKAIEKRLSGRNPTVREMAALNRAIRTCDEAARDRIYRTVPIEDIASMTGLTIGQLREYASLYGVPTLHAQTVNLYELLPRLHELAEAWHSKRS